MSPKVIVPPSASVSVAPGPRLALGPVVADLAQPVGREEPVAVGEPLVEREAVVLRSELAQLVEEHHVVLVDRGVGEEHVGHGAATVEGPQHRHHRGDAAAADDEEHLRRRRVGQHEVALRRLQPDDRARREPVDQVLGQEALGHRLHGDRDGALRAHGRRRQRVGPPVEPAVDLHADADVLAGLEVERPAPAGLDDERRRAVGDLLDPLDAAAQLARGPQRVDELEVVVGVQRRRERLADRTHATQHGRPLDQ
nr:hypothetical protein [Aeromicrobium sp. REDSEA-S38_B2]